MFELQHCTCSALRAVTNSLLWTTRFNTHPTRMSIKPNPLQSALGLTHKSLSCVWKIIQAWPRQRKKQHNEISSFKATSRAHVREGWCDGEDDVIEGRCDGRTMWWRILWTPSGSTPHSGLKIPVWRHNNTLMDVCQPIFPSTARGLSGCHDNSRKASRTGGDGAHVWLYMTQSSDI